jgi:hypothetical protein
MHPRWISVALCLFGIFASDLARAEDAAECKDDAAALAKVNAALAELEKGRVPDRVVGDLLEIVNE